jgi:ketosteroid isomerase-like protein
VNSSRASVDLVLRGYHAFVAGDLTTVASLLAPDVEWYGVGGGAPSGMGEIGEVLASRYADSYRIELEHCVGKGEEVLLELRASGVQKDPTDERPLQTRRYYTVGRYWGVVTVHDGLITRVQDFPSMQAALDSLGLDAAEI